MPLPSRTYSLCAFCIALILTSCGNSDKISTNQLAEKYQNSQLNIDVKYSVFHFSDDSTRLYVRLNTKHLLYARRGGNEATAIAQIAIQPVEISGENTRDLEEKSFRILDKDQAKENKTLVAFTDFPLPFGKNYRFKISFRDMNRETSQTTNIKVEKSDYSSRQNFMISEIDKNVPKFTDRILPNHAYRLSANSSAPSTISGFYYKRSFPLPPPPFSIYNPDPFDYSPDSTLFLEEDTNQSVKFTTSNTGFYHFLFDTTQKEGFTVFVSAAEFPEVKTVENMVDPFRYLVGSKEYSAILEAENPKAKIESYWIEWSGSRDRARKAIRAYYQRVEDANKLFSSYLEGWKSDRGLIYIIYGKPNKAYREGQVETWIYGEENNPLSITFHFIKVINPFTENDYRLNREDIYKPSWYRAVNIWRDGRIY